MADSQSIQTIIDNCTQAAHDLRINTNTMLCAMERQSATLGAAHIEMCINSLVQAKSRLS